MRFYNELAEWWPLLSPTAEYEEEAAFYRNALLAALAGGVGGDVDGGAGRPSVLELGCGGGSNAFHLKRHFEMVLTDVSPSMLDVSRAVNPECEHVAGDMRSLRLRRTFDCVFVHDAVAYMTSADDLHAAMETAFVHCRPGGVALFAPDYVRETFNTGSECGGHDGTDRGLRFLEWHHDPDPGDSTYVVDYAFMLRHPDGSITVEHERHVEGLFARDEWIRMLRDVGFDPKVATFEHSEVERPLDVFVVRKPE